MCLTKSSGCSYQSVSSVSPATLVSPVSPDPAAAAADDDDDPPRRRGFLGLLTWTH